MHMLRERAQQPLRRLHQPTHGITCYTGACYQSAAACHADSAGLWLRMLQPTSHLAKRRDGPRRGVLFGPDAALAVARGCPALRAWDIRCCQLTRRQVAALMAARPHVALMSSGKPAFIADERAFTVFEGDELPPSRMSLRQHLETLVRGQRPGMGQGAARMRPAVHRRGSPVLARWRIVQLAPRLSHYVSGQVIPKCPGDLRLHKVARALLQPAAPQHPVPKWRSVQTLQCRVKADGAGPGEPALWRA